MFNEKWIHMIGIGGISMSGIAEILLSMNCKITGYDANESPITKHLISKGIDISYEYNLDNVKNADIVVYTAAIKDDNDELKYAKDNNKELYERSVFLGLMMKEYENVICISGTHGKSTTSGMVSTIFLEENLNPTIQIGAMLPLINGNFHVGNKKYFIAEACEYVDSFLDFYPTSEIILNIDDDHLDYFKNIDNIKKSFKKYINLLPNNGILVVNNDDQNTIDCTKDIQNKITYGINNKSNFMAKNITYNENGYPEYDLYINDDNKCHIILSVNGNHNIYNSLAATALTYQYGIKLESIKKALNKYKGVQRRFEFIGTYNNANIYDDYAHHPSEIKTTLESVKNTKHNKCYAIFQGHTYSRTKDHLNEFADILSKFDNIIIAKIYPARETNIYNVHEEDLVDLIKKNGNNNVIYIDDFNKIENYIKENIQDNDLIVTIGAGPINKIAYSIAGKELK